MEMVTTVVPHDLTQIQTSADALAALATLRPFVDASKALTALVEYVRVTDQEATERLNAYHASLRDVDAQIQTKTLTLRHTQEELQNVDSRLAQSVEAFEDLRAAHTQAVQDLQETFARTRQSLQRDIEDLEDAKLAATQALRSQDEAAQAHLNTLRSEADTLTKDIAALKKRHFGE